MIDSQINSEIVCLSIRLNNWNIIETIMINATDELVPIIGFHNNVSVQSQKIPVVMKRKLALRKRLLNSLKRNPNEELKTRLQQLNAEIMK